MHREKLEVQGNVKDNSIKQCKKKVINTYNRVPPIITIFFLIFFKKPIRRFTIFFLSRSNKIQYISAMVCRLYMSLYRLGQNILMQIAMRPNQSCAESPRNYQSLLREIITFLDNFNDKVLGLYSVVKLDLI